MATNLNLDSLTVGQNGRAFFNGLGSGIDIQGAVDGLIEAKRIPIDRMEQRIADRELKMVALRDVQTLALGLRDAVARLRGAISFDGASDVFKAKHVFASSTRDDAQSPTQAAELIGFSVTNAAQAASHTIEVLQIAKAHKVASASIASAPGTALGLAGSFEINGRTIAIDADDTLIELRDRINAANSGDGATGVTASIVSISASEQVLMLTADETGTDAAIVASDTAGGVLQSLGVLDGGGAFSDELQAAQNAQIKVDGLAATIERRGNTIDDVFSGVTVSLFKAEAGTTVQLDVERDLTQVKQAIVDFVAAYNDLRSFLNQQAQIDVPEDDETGAGILAGTSALSEIRSRLSASIGAAVQGDDPIFRVLAQIGITFQGANTLEIDETRLDEALLNETDAVRELFAFGLSSSSPDAVLVGFDGNTSYSAGGYQLNVAYAGGSIVSANVGGPADGSDDGSVSVQGNVLTVLQGGAKGLKVMYTGDASASGIQLDVSVGVGAQLHAAMDLLADDDGPIAAEIDSITGQNQLNQDRIARLEERLERERERLFERFVAMETALASMNQLMESLRQQIDSSFYNGRR